MALLNVNPTRMQLTKLKKQLTTAIKGHRLLKDKRDELMRRFLDLIKENKQLREEVEEALKEANSHFALASSIMKKEELEAALLAPKQEAYLEVSSKNVMSVNIPVFDVKTRTDDTSDIYSYGFGSTSFELDDAVTKMSDILPKLLQLAEVEKSTALLAAEIEKTRRRVNALEHVMIPNYQDTIKYIAMKLEESERSSRSRLMKVKDMMLAQAHGYNEE
ncbi:MAG: V-type ATP synthase subunit D [Clostridia bacterium]|nr:V-type ATP synthase subunit D [Clostridia bacterium]